MFGWKDYTLTTRGEAWPASEGTVTDSARGQSVAVIREEPWPEVLERPWPDGARSRPWLFRLLSVEGNPRQCRTVVRRSDNGHSLILLHQRQPLFNKTIGIFGAEDRRIGYARWSFKGGGTREQFDLVLADHRRLAEVRWVSADVYRVAEAEGGREWATVAIARSETKPGSPKSCRVLVKDSAPSGDADVGFLLAAALILFMQG